MLCGFKFRNAGQVCISPTRFYVQEGAYDRFVARFLAKVEKLKVGDGLAADTRMGPLAQARRVTAIAGFIDDAHQRGATVLAAGYDGVSFTPGGASRIPDGTDSNAATDWVRNDFDLAGIPGFTGTLVAGEALNTPGAANATTAPVSLCTPILTAPKAPFPKSFPSE